jgi:uncharacterized protein with ATP-grasp and redox domains
LKAYLDCLPCLLNQSLRVAREVTRDEAMQKKVMDRVAQMIPELPLGLKPPEMTRLGYRIINEITGNNDPFRRIKDEANQAVLAACPRLKKLVPDTADELFTACRLAMAGNSIDLGPKFECGSVTDIIEAAGRPMPLAINDFDWFSSNIRNAQHLLYLGDNAGEIVFDRLFIEEIQRVKNIEICFVVRGSPVINDVTVEDALAVGMDKVARVISNGSDAPGTILAECSPELKRLYHSADIIISKGQGNYESLEDEPGNILFLLRAKCSLIANSLGVKVGDYVIKRQENIIK